ncbi:MAG: formimidoylglutamate deiminase [Cyclobacteriaceae bacterium]|nr:formimidoylglutamate deiminase [Cyclobacteriaceae bacterium]
MTRPKPKDQKIEVWSRAKTPDQILGYAREMRKNPTEAEALLWANLRNRKLNNLKFRRQQHIQGFILDFYCDAARLGVEVDGRIHLSKEQIKYDNQRTAYLAEFGIRIIRFTNEEVKENLKGVLSKILSEASISSPSPRPRASATPLPGERGRGEGLKFYRFTSLLQKEGWLESAYVGVDAKGVVQYLSSAPPGYGIAVESVAGFALPGFQNAHSHAFQYAMAGLAENHPAGVADDFWTWREAMYQCALSLDPDQAQAVAAMLYAEMVRVGYTHVAEFHYLHHDKEGGPYAQPAEMGLRMVEAAKQAGIKITLIPVFYQKGGFGLDPQPRQRRFISKTVDDYFKLLDASAEAIKDYADATLGFSVHSLRAVELNDIKTTFQQGPKQQPFHLHVAEQKKEISDCLAYCAKRPMQWLLDNVDVNDRFNLVHSTHLDDDELTRLAKSGASVVLCPSTEGNLGDGIFRMKEYVRLGGKWCIGTDSHIGLNPLEEFRMIDYRQRLITNQRNTFEGDAAAYLVNEGIASGRRAMGVASPDHFEIGQPLDAVVYHSGSHLLAHTSAKNRLATLLYTGDTSRIAGTLVNGKWVVKDQHHQNGHAIKAAFAKAMQAIKNR